MVFYNNVQLFKNYFSKKSQADLRIYFSDLYISLFKFAEIDFN